MLRLTIDFWKSTMDIQAYVMHNKTGKPRNLPMTFDTGAYITSVDADFLRRAGYDVKKGKSTAVNTVGRKNIPANEILLRGLELGDIGCPRIALGPVLVYAIDMSDAPETIGVLGMNVIREFKVSICFGAPSSIELHPTFDLKLPVLYENFMRNSSRFGLWSESSITGA